MLFRSAKITLFFLHFTMPPKKSLQVSANAASKQKRMSAIRKHPFALLAEFLERNDDVTHGRSAEPPRQLALKLRAFAAGKLSAKERTKVAETLAAQPEWVGCLAAEILKAKPEIHDRRRSSSRS